MKEQIYSTELGDLQGLREQATGDSRLEIQKRIDDHFFKNPTIVRKKKKKIRIQDEEDMWY